jgi:hypothetical protein
MIVRTLLVNRNLSTSGFGSGSSWLDDVNGILMQQELNLPKQDYWNRRAIASLASQHLNHSRGARLQCLYCLLCCCYSPRNACMKHCCYTNTCVNSYHYYQLWEGNKQCKKATSEAYLLCNLSPHGCVISFTPHQLVVYYRGSWSTYILTYNSCRRNI